MTPEEGGAPVGADGGGRGGAWLDGRGQDMPPGPAVVLCCRTAEPWTPARGRRLRADAARRLPPLTSGHRDPDGTRTDAPSEDYARWLVDADAERVRNERQRRL